MEFNRTIVITDPGYFAKDSNWGEEFDYDNYTISLPEFSDYIWDATGFGDGSFRAYQLNNITGQRELENYIEQIEEVEEGRDKNPSTTNRIKLEKLQQNQTPIGQFCVDSGSFGVFYLDEVLKYNPSFLADYGEWCYTIVENFCGLVEIVRNSTGDPHFIGVGTKTFYTI